MFLRTIATFGLLMSMVGLSWASLESNPQTMQVSDAIASRVMGGTDPPCETPVDGFVNMACINAGADMCTGKLPPCNLPCPFTCTPQTKYQRGTKSGMKGNLTFLKCPTAPQATCDLAMTPNGLACQCNYTTITQVPCLPNPWKFDRCDITGIRK
jgi:hypothetical protein